MDATRLDRLNLSPEIKANIAANPALMEAMLNDPDVANGNGSSVEYHSNTLTFNEEKPPEILWKEKVTQRLNEDKKKIAMLEEKVETLNKQIAKVVEECQTKLKKWETNSELNSENTTIYKKDLTN